MSARSKTLAVILGLLVVSLVVLVPTRRGEVLGGGGLLAFLGAFIVLSAVVGRDARRPSVVDALLARRPRRPARPSDLEKLERSIGWGTYDGAEFDARVRPKLAGLIRHRGGEENEVDSILAHGDRVVTEDIERMVTDIESLRAGTRR